MRECDGCGRRGEYIYQSSFKIFEKDDQIDSYTAKHLPEDPRNNHRDTSSGKINICPRCLERSEIIFDISLPSK